MHKKYYKLIILIPILGERENIDKLIKSLRKINVKYAVVFIVTILSDTKLGSPINKIKNYRGGTDSIYYLTNSVRGLGLAYKKGFDYVQKNFSFSYLCTMDADGSHDAMCINSLMKNMTYCDLLIASRYSGGGCIKNWHFVRHTGSRAINKLINFLSPYNIYDATSGFRIYSARLLNRVDLSILRSRGFVFQVEILFRIIRSGGVFLEIPYRFKGRTRGRSKLRIQDVLEYLLVAVIPLLELFVNKLINIVHTSAWYIWLAARIAAIKFFSYFNGTYQNSLRLLIKITNNCNFRCTTCGNWRDRNKKYLSLLLQEKIYNKYRGKLMFLSITGGEPFFDKEYLINAVSLASQKNPHLKYISINTNGYCTDNILYTANYLLQQFIFLKIYLGINFIPNAEWGYQRTGKKDSFLRVKQTTEKLLELAKRYKKRLHVYKIFTVNSREDFQYTEKINEDIWINFVEVDKFYNNNNLCGINKLSPEMKIKLIEKILYKNRNLGLLNRRYLLNLKQITKIGRSKKECYAGVNRIYVDEIGEEYICTRGLKFRERQKSEKCRYCWTPCEAVFDIIQL